MAYFTISGGTHYSEVDLTNYDGVIVEGIGGTVDGWTGVDAAKTIQITGGSATLETAQWNSNFTVTVDLTDSSATGGNAWKAIDYTSDDTVTYGFITLAGGTKAGGYALDNDLYVGSHVYYNDPSFTSDTTSAVINGATFAVVYGGTDYKTANANAYSFKDEAAKNTLCWSGISRQFSGNTPIVIYTGSGYKPTSGAGDSTLKSDTLFQDVSFITDCSWGVYLLGGTGDVTATVRDTDFKSIVVYSMYGSTSIGNGTVYLENCTFGSFNGVHSACTASGAYTVSIVNRPGTETRPSFSTIMMGDYPYTVGSLRMNLENIIATTVTFGKGSTNIAGNAIVLGGATATITGSTIKDFYAVNQSTASAKITTDSTHEYTGDVSVEFSGSTITNKLFLGTADTSVVVSGNTLYSRNVLHDSLNITIKNGSWVTVLTGVQGGTVCGNLEVDLDGSTLSQANWSKLVEGGTVAGDAVFRAHNGSFVGLLSVAPSGVIGGKLVVDISGSSVYSLQSLCGAQLNGGLSVTLNSIQTSSGLSLAADAASINGDVDVIVRDTEFAQAVTLLKSKNPGADKHADVTFDGATFSKALTVLSGSTVGSASVVMDNGCLLKATSGNVLFSGSTVVNNAGFTLSKMDLADITGIAQNSSVIGGTLSVELAGVTSKTNFSLVDATSSVSGDVDVTVSGSSFSELLSLINGRVGGDLEVTLDGTTLSKNNWSKLVEGGTVAGDAVFRVRNGSNAIYFSIAYSGVIGGDLVVDISGSSIGNLQLLNGAQLNGDISVTLDHFLTTGEFALAADAASINGDVDVIVRDTEFAQAVTLLKSKNPGADKHADFTFDGATFNAKLIMLSGSTVGSASVVMDNGCSLKATSGNVLFSGSTVVNNAGFTLSQMDLADITGIAKNSSVIGGTLSVELAGVTSKNTFSLVDATSTVSGDVDVTVSGSSFSDELQINGTVGGDLEVTLDGSTLSKNNWSKLINGGTVAEDAVFRARNGFNAIYFSVAPSGVIGGDLVVDISGSSIGTLQLNGSGTVGGNLEARFTNFTSGKGISFTKKQKGQQLIGGTVTMTLSGVNDLGIDVAAAGSDAISKFDDIYFTTGATLDLNYLKYTANQKITIDGKGFTGVVCKVVTSDRTDITYTGTVTIDNNDEGNLKWLQNGTGFNITVYQDKGLDTVYVNSNFTAENLLEEIDLGGGTIAYYQANAWKTLDEGKAAAAASGQVIVLGGEISGDLGGGTNVLTSGTTITANLYGGTSDDYTGNIDLTLNGASSSATVLGGGSSLDSKVDGNIALTLTDATVDRIVYGGGQSGTVTGSITTTVSGDSKIGKNFYGGSLISSETYGTYTAGAVNVYIEGGSFGGHVVGGSRVNGASFTEDTNSWLKQSVDSVALNVTGGTFFERASVFAGGYLVGKQNKDVQLEITNGVNVTLNADILGDTATYGSIGVYGGALASNYGTASIGKGTSAYAVQITVEGGHYSAIYGAGWAESNANSQVSGGVSIKVTGGSIGSLFAGGNNDTTGATANVTDGGAIITLEGGTVNNLYASSKWGTSKITGNTEVNVKGGTITGILSGKNYSGNDSVTGTQTLDLDASISCGQVLGFDVWEVAENATLTAAEEINLKDVTLDFGSATSGWNIATAEDGFVNLDDATIKLGSVAWAWNETDTCWYGDTNQWKLAIDNTGKTLTLSKLA